MLNISITKETTEVQNVNLGCKWTIKTSEFFGLVLEKLEYCFPDFDADLLGARIAAHVIKGVNGVDEKEPVQFFGCTELGATLCDLLHFIDGRSVITPTLKEIEEMRIAHRMAANFLPVSITDKDSMRFEGLVTVTQVMIAALYYYAYNDLKLVRCKHCGRWFATDTLKKEYCDRESPCFGNIIKGKTPLTCEQAVRNIQQKCSRIKNRIETKASQTVAAQLHDSSFLLDFSRKCIPLYDAAKKSPTVSNLTNYYNFLKSTEERKGWLV